MKYECICGYVYDETAGDSDIGISPGTKWDDLPEDFVCPVCGAGKDHFHKYNFASKFTANKQIRKNREETQC